MKRGRKIEERGDRKREREMGGGEKKKLIKVKVLWHSVSAPTHFKRNEIYLFTTLIGEQRMSGGEREKERETERETDRKRERERVTERERKKEGEIERERERKKEREKKRGEERNR